MKKAFIFLPLVVVLFMSCKKSDTAETTPVVVVEPQIAFNLDAVNNSIALSSSFAVTATLTSTLPSSQGVKIEVTVLDETSSSPITQSAAVTSTTSANALQLISLPQQHLCNATVKVSSVKTPSNTASKSFTVVYK